MKTQRHDPLHKVALQDRNSKFTECTFEEQCYKIHATVLTMSQHGKLISTMLSSNLFASLQTDQMLVGSPELDKCFIIKVFLNIYL